MNRAPKYDLRDWSAERGKMGNPAGHHGGASPPNAVWGHFFVANLVISLFFFVLYACLMVAIFGSTFGNLIQNQP